MTRSVRVLWRRVDTPGLEHAAVEESAAGIVLRGAALLAHEAQACRLEYEVRCDPAWVSRTARVTGSIGGRAIDASVHHEGGRWTLNGSEVPGVAGCVDVDLNFSPSTNLLPIRRLDLPIGGRASVRAAWLRFPGFALEPLEQVYTRVAAHRYRYESSGGAFTAEIEVDATGLPVAYGGVWTAIAR